MNHNLLLIIISSAIMSASATMVGQNMGAGKPERVTRTVWQSWGLTMVFLAVVGTVFLLFPRDPLCWAPVGVI